MAHYVCFTGGRDYADHDCVHDVIRMLAEFYGDDLRIMHGGAAGADSLVDEIAREFDVRVKVFEANWTTYGKPAGVIRNAAMANYLEMCESKGHTVEVIAFPGNRGTQDMIRQAESRQINVQRF